jgi:hypothetical protein
MTPSWCDQTLHATRSDRFYYTHPSLRPSSLPPQTAIKPLCVPTMPNHITFDSLSRTPSRRYVSVHLFPRPVCHSERYSILTNKVLQSVLKGKFPVDISTDQILWLIELILKNKMVAICTTCFKAKKLHILPQSVLICFLRLSQ